MEKHPLDDLNPPSKRRRQDDESLPQEQVAAQQPPEDKLHNEETFCDDCRAVNWSSLPAMAADGLMETKNLNLRSVTATIEELKNSSCRICVFLSTMKRSWFDRTRCVLKALPFRRHFGYDGPEISRLLRHTQYIPNSISQCTVLGITEEKDRRQDCYEMPSLAVVRRDGLESRRVKTSSVDYNELKGLVKICETEHKRCRSADSRPNVQGLELIDTRTQAVIKAPDHCEYLALSYVWGKQADDGSVHNIHNSPPVIKDAISVTNRMGYDYLWVDRYCISDSEDKPKMISQMDQIYANASITIIAAADGDTEMGLCGVSMPRKPQQQINIQDVSLLELPLGHEELTFSKWASSVPPLSYYISRVFILWNIPEHVNYFRIRNRLLTGSRRGWTYQEGYLSTRRLIFTSTQILFLCNGMYAAESLQKLLQAPCYAERIDNFFHLIPKSTISRRTFSVEDLLKQISEYSKRELTRSSDSLNAFLGVLNYYSKSSAKMTSPVLQLPWGLVAKKPKRKISFRFNFFWFHTGKGPVARRAGFPSWSWTGWGGELFFYRETVLQPEQEVEQGPFAYLDWEFSMRETDGRVIKMYELARKEFEARKDKHRLHQPGPNQLQISCLVIPVTFQEFDLSEDQKKQTTEISISDTGKTFQVGRNMPGGAHPVLQVWEGIYVGVDKERLKWDQQVEQNDHILGLISAERYENVDWTVYYCLLVRQVGEGLYERVGWLWLHELDLARHSATNADELKEQRIFVDLNSHILEQFTILERQRRYLFTDTAETRTICII